MKFVASALSRTNPPPPNFEWDPSRLDCASIFCCQRKLGWEYHIIAAAAAAAAAAVAAAAVAAEAAAAAAVAAGVAP
jgi:hypothetical protein